MSASCGKSSCTPLRRCRTPVVMPDTIVIGNSRPFAPWMVRMRTASSSVSGSTVSTTRAPSALWRSAQRGSRAGCRRRRRSRTRGPGRRRSAPGATGRVDARRRTPTSSTRRSRTMRSSSSLGAEPQPRVVPRRERAHRLADRMVGAAATRAAAPGGSSARRARRGTCRGRRRRSRTAASAAR